MQSSKFALFLGDLSMHCNEADLEEAFSPYGIILEIRVKRSKETAKTLSYGFLEFASASSAVNAMNDMDGAVLKGRPLRIRWAASKKNPVRKRDIREDLSDRISMHVKFMSYKIETVITEELLRNLFSIYGEVCDTTIKQISIDRKSHRLKGYGFVSYFNDEAGYMAAQRALTELHDKTLDDITYKCELSNIIDAAAPVNPQHGPGGPYHGMNHHNGMGLNPNSPHGGGGHGPLSPGAISEYDFGADSPAQQGSYFDDFAVGGGHPAALGGPSPRTHHAGYSGMLHPDDVGVPVLEKSNSGGTHSIGHSTSGFTTNASMSLNSSKHPSRTSSLEKDSLSPGALDFRTTPYEQPLQEGPRMNAYAPSVPGHFGRSPGRAAISASPLLSSYQTVGAPLAGGPVGMPRAPPAVQRPYHHQQAPPQQQGQYPSQVRYQPNREAYPSPQLSHLGVAGGLGGMGGLYESAQQTQAGRRAPSLTGSPQMPSPGYWNPQQGPPPPPPQGRAYSQHGSPAMAHSSPRGTPNNNFYGQAPHQQQQQQQQGSQAPRYSPQQHYAPQGRVNTQGLHQQQPHHLQQPQHHQPQHHQPPHHHQPQQQQAPLYSRYSPPTQYAQPNLSPALSLNNHHSQGSQGPQAAVPQGQGQGQGSPFFAAASRSHSGSSDQGMPMSSPGHPHSTKSFQPLSQGLSQGPNQGLNQGLNPGLSQGSPGPGYVGGYNAQNREFHPAQPSQGLQIERPPQGLQIERPQGGLVIERPPPLPTSTHFSPHTSNTNTPGRLYGDLSLDPVLLNSNTSREGLVRDDYFGLSTTNNNSHNNNNTNATTTSGAGSNNSSGWFAPPQDLPLM